MPGDCGAPGPWGAECTEFYAHRWSHYNSGRDSSWRDDWRDETPPEGGGTYVDEEGPE